MGFYEHRHTAKSRSTFEKNGLESFSLLQSCKTKLFHSENKKRSLSLIVKSSTFNRFHVLAIDDWNISNNLYLQKFLRRSTWVTFHCGKYFKKSL